MTPVSYALDIGVYNLGAQAQILSSTTAAWARATEGPASFNAIAHSGSVASGRFNEPAGRTWQCGRSIRHLADAIDSDLASGRSVALGFEAPMWFPLERDHRRSLRLFAPRFTDEARSAWYLQSGAAATLKAISLGVMLFSIILAKHPDLRLTTRPGSLAERTIVLFEAFVVGRFRMPAPSSIEGTAPNAWDAFIASLAWGAIHSEFTLPPESQPHRLHAVGSSAAETISVWKLIAGVVRPLLPIDGPADCDVVALGPSP